MKTSLLIVFTLACFLSMFSSLSQNAFACSCDGYPDYLRILIESKAAFQGTVTEIIQDDHHEKVYFDITFPQKGISHTGEYVIEQSTWSSCTVNYNVGETYQVFTYNDDGIMDTTNMCSTKQITGFYEYSHEDENGQVDHYREDYNILTQYNMGTIILPVSIAIIVLGFIIWKKRR